MPDDSKNQYRCINKETFIAIKKTSAVEIKEIYLNQ